MPEIEIIPAVMPRTIEELRDMLSRVNGAAPRIQLDVMDGKFVPNVSFPYEVRGRLGKMPEDLPLWEDFDYELDLMVEDPHETIGAFLALGAARVVVHLESCEAPLLLRAIEEAKRFDCETGIALANDTPLERLFPLIGSADFIQVMGIARVGFQGEPFDARAISRIEELRSKHPELIISVDGAVNFETAAALADAGANRLVSGSAIFESDDARAAIAELRELVS
jgi:ribulose-phosphate 3-epimerase